MKRRTFLENAIKSMASVAITPALLTACEAGEIKNDKSVIIIGAGIAGLAAASMLNEKFEVLVLEAQDKVGGRLRTNRSLGVAFDEGASWIHGIEKNPITDLAQKAGMKTLHTDDEDFVSYDMGGLKHKDEIFERAEEEFYAVLESLMKSGSPEQSFREVFNAKYPQHVNNRLWKFFLSTYLTFDTGGLDELSSLLYHEGEEFAGIEKIATNGYDTIPNYLAKEINIQLNQRVTKIDSSGHEVKVFHNGKVSVADYVVVTVPLGVLKQNKITFTPELPSEKQEAIEGIGMNCVNKFLLTWEEGFWDDAQFIAYTPEVSDKFNYFVNVKKMHPNLNALITPPYTFFQISTSSYFGA